MRLRILIVGPFDTEVFGLRITTKGLIEWNPSLYVSVAVGKVPRILVPLLVIGRSGKRP